MINKNILLLLIGVSGLLGGCSSIATRMQDRYVAVAPQERVFAATQKIVYEAAQLAVKRVGLLLGRKSFASGRIEAYTPIRSGDPTSDARQTTLSIRLDAADPASTRVGVLVWEHLQGAFPGGVSDQALPQHGLYIMYFDALEQVLRENGSLR